MSMDSSKETLSLLPRAQGEFASRAYWDRFFRTLRRGGGVDTTGGSASSFEWYGCWKDFRDAVMFELQSARESPSFRSLVVGCGNSTMSEDMWTDGMKRVFNVDFSEEVVKEMETRAKEKCMDGLEYLVMNMLDLETSWTETFDAVFDKGALDALMANDSVESHTKGSRMLQEIDRVLKPGGTYFCVSLAQGFVLRLLLETFRPDEGYRIHIHAFEPLADSALIPFVFAFQKTCDKENRTIKLFQEAGKFGESVQDFPNQVYQLIEDRRVVYHMKRNIKATGTGLRAKFSLWDTSSISLTKATPRFIVSVIDSGLDQQEIAVPCAVFLVPQGREHEWTFSSSEGQMQVAVSNKIGRLIVVSLGRTHEFSSIASVQKELSASMLELLPDSLRNQKGLQFPYMTLGPNLGIRNSLERVESEISGVMVVEDVEMSEPGSDRKNFHRRLVFLDSCDIIQSEGRLEKDKQGKKTKNGKRKITYRVDHAFLTFEFHRTMIAGTFLRQELVRDKDIKPRVAVIGLGSGALAMYLARHAKWLLPTVDAVELDPKVVEMARKWFGLAGANSTVVQVHIGDGVEFLRSSTRKYDFIFLDVDAKDLTQPVSFPPVEFLEKSFLFHLRDQNLVEDGAMVLNLACKSKAKQAEILLILREIFAKVLCIPLHAIGDTNCVVLAFKHWVEQDPEHMLTHAKTQALAIKAAHGHKHDFLEDMDDLSIVREDGMLQALQAEGN